MERLKTQKSKYNTVGELTLFDFKTYCKTIVIKIVWYWQKNRQREQQNRIEGPEIDPRKYGQWIFDKGTMEQS